MDHHDGMEAARLLARCVMGPVRERGLRPPDGGPAASWRHALPGMQGEMCGDDRGALCFVSDALYEFRRSLLVCVMPRLS